MDTENHLSNDAILQILSEVEESSEGQSNPNQPTMAATAVDSSGKLIHIHNVSSSLAAEDRRENLETPVTINLLGGEQTEGFIISMNGKYI
jgi:hypothetical protein